MPTNDDFKQTLVDIATSTRGALYDALSRRNIYAIAAGEDPQDLVPPALCHALYFNGLVFRYDSSDTTTAHDGVTCLVTFDAKRFKADTATGRLLRRYVALDKDLTAPPASPSLGDSYIVAAGATGAWAGKDKKLAQFTARSWVFIQPNAYDECTVLDESLVYSYSALGVWTAGVTGISLPVAGVNISNLKYGLGLRVFNQTTTTPPATPATGDAYIVPTGATGAWSGHVAKIAIWESGAWTMLAAQAGWTVFDLSIGKTVVWTGSVWLNPFASDWTQIEDWTASSDVAQKDFTGLTYYNHYRARFFKCIPTLSGQLAFRVSTNNGASFLSGASDYYVYNSSFAFGPITSNNVFPGAANKGVYGDCSFFGARDGLRMSYQCYVATMYTATQTVPDTNAGHTNVAGTFNALRFYFTAGLIAAGSRIIFEGRN